MSSSKVRCRAINDDDLEGVAALLHRGFPARRPAWWLRGLHRQASLPRGTGDPKYGFLLDAGGNPVGVILLITRLTNVDGRSSTRCNLSSWYVEPDHRGYASLLVFAALKRKTVTYTNISPAPHTWATIEAQGFRRYSGGLYFAAAALGPAPRHVGVESFDPASATSAALSAEDRDLLSVHAGFGCISLVCSSPDGVVPFVFLPMRVKGGRIPIPCVQLVYCRDEAGFVRFAGPLGRFLLRHAGAVAVALDANGPVEGLAGRYVHAWRPKFFKGPDEPRRGDLAFSELVLFGP